MSSPLPLKPRLVAISGSFRGTTFALDVDEISIGRDRENVVRLNHPSVSRRHCLIKRDGEQFTISDLDSYNGTFVNGVPVKEQKLAHADQIEIGDIVLLFLMHEDNEVFRSLPRAGRRLAPRLLAEIGDEHSRYADAKSLQALAGTSPVLFQSGNYAKAHRRLGCIKPLRNALHQFAWQSSQQTGWACDYYQRKRAEGKSHTVAVRALANVWARIIFAMLSKHTLYDSATFEAAQRLHDRRVV